VKIINEKSPETEAETIETNSSRKHKILDECHVIASYNHISVLSP
jgi:hypothetical protein